jgi:hypothetical protein
MRFKYLNNGLVGLVLSVVLLSGVAHAGLIVGDNEWLDLSITNGLSREQVEDNILTQSQYSDYEYATTADLNVLHTMMLGAHFNIIDNVAAGWTSPFKMSGQELVIARWFQGAAGTGTASIDGVLYDEYSSGWFQTERTFGQAVSKANLAGHLNLGYSTATDAWISYDRSFSDYANLSSPVEYKAWNANNPASWMNHALVRQVDVPEPSTLAIFALGMIGLASRRFKKQS